MRKQNKIYDNQLRRLVANFLNANMVALSNGHLEQFKPSEITIIDKSIDMIGDNKDWEILRSVTFMQRNNPCVKRIHYTCNGFRLEYLK